MTEDAPLRAANVSKSYGDFPALHDIDLEVAEGEWLVLVGHNGSGKSTLLRIAAGLTDATSGEVMIFGAKAGTLEARIHTAYLPDTPVFYDDLSLMEHLEYVARLHETPDWRDKAEGLLEHLSLADRADDLPARFSRGLQQRAQIALGLVRPLSLLLVDEPFVGLDVGGRAAFLELLESAHEEEVTIVLVTHQLELVERADRCVVLREGRIVHAGAVDPQEIERLVVG